MPEPAAGLGKGKKLPKSFWIIGIGAALVIGLYLRSRSSSSSSSAATPSTSADVTSQPYTYTSGGAYPTDTLDPSTGVPWAQEALQGSLLGNSGLTGLPSGFDPTSFQEGISYAQNSLGLPSMVTSDTTNSAPVPLPLTVTGPSPALASIEAGVHKGSRTGRPHVSGRRHPGSTHPTHRTHTTHKKKKK